MTKSRVAQLEQLESIKGNNQVRLSLLRAVAGYYKVNMLWLVCGPAAGAVMSEEDGWQNPDSDFASLVRNISLLPKEYRQVVAAMVSEMLNLPPPAKSRQRR